MLHLYLPLAEEAEIYDNSGKRRVLVAEKRADGPVIVHEQRIWMLMRETAQ